MFTDICKPVKVGKAQRLQPNTARSTVCIGIIIWNKRQADETIALASIPGNALQISTHLPIGPKSVRPIDIGIAILNINNPRIDNWQKRIYIPSRHIERGFYIDFPICATAFPKTSDKLRTERGLTSTKGNPATGNEEIKFVYADFRVQLLRSVVRKACIIFECLRIDTITATKRTAMEYNERGYPLTIRPKTMTVDCADFRLKHFHHCRVFLRNVRPVLSRKAQKVKVLFVDTVFLRFEERVFVQNFSRRLTGEVEELAISG